MPGESEHPKMIPLTGDPEFYSLRVTELKIFNKFMTELGVKSDYKFHDLWSFNKEDLKFFPKSVLAIIFLFPVDESKALKKSSIGVPDVSTDSNMSGTIHPSEKVTFLTQKVQNTCGAVALLHALLNNLDVLEYGYESIINTLSGDFRLLVPEERGLLLAQSSDIARIHDTCSKINLTQPPESLEDVNTHFSCLLKSEDMLIELDGRKPKPVIHGNCSNLLEGAIALMNERINEFKGEENAHQFSAMIFAPSS